MGTIRKRSKSSYEISWYDAGKKRFETVKGDKDAAKKALRAREVAVDEGRSTEPTKEKLHGYLDSWLDAYAPQLRQNTVSGYRLSIKRLKATIPDQRLTDLKPLQIEKAYAALAGQGLAPQTILHAHHLLHNALGNAVRLGILAVNVVDRVKAPRLNAQPPRAITYDQAVTIIGKAEPLYQSAFMFLLYTGMRRSELCALMWRDVDLDRAAIRILASIDNIEGKHADVVRSPVKTARSNRTIQLSNTTVELLRHWRGALDTEAPYVPHGIERKNSPYVFPGVQGGLLHPDLLTAAWSRATKAAGITVRLHDLRHTHASLMLSLGVELPVVSARLGHSSTAVTGAIYAHVIAGREREAVEKFDQHGKLSGNLVAKPKTKGSRREA